MQHRQNESKWELYKEGHRGHNVNKCEFYIWVFVKWMVVCLDFDTVLCSHWWICLLHHPVQIGVLESFSVKVKSLLKETQLPIPSLLSFVNRDTGLGWLCLFLNRLQINVCIEETQSKCNEVDFLYYCMVMPLCKYTLYHCYLQFAIFTVIQPRSVCSSLLFFLEKKDSFMKVKKLIID